MDRIQTSATAPVNWQSRCQVALSLANNEQRDPARNLALIRAALVGATVQDLLDMERLGTETF